MRLLLHFGHAAHPQWRTWPQSAQVTGAVFTVLIGQRPRTPSRAVSLAWASVALPLRTMGTGKRRSIGRSSHTCRSFHERSGSFRYVERPMRPHQFAWTLAARLHANSRESARVRSLQNSLERHRQAARRLLGLHVDRSRRNSRRDGDIRHIDKQAVRRSGSRAHCKRRVTVRGNTRNPSFR